MNSKELNNLIQNKKETCFKNVFIFEDEFLLMGNLIKIYIKGFFFEEHDPRGVEIQSFKKSKPNLKVIK